jgi:hypothetical protein
MPSSEEYWRLSDGVGNWVFAAVCFAIALVLMRLILRERITLQGSMSYLAFLALLGGMVVFPDTTGWVAHALGFSTLANFFFCAAIASLIILHLRALITLSRVQLRSIALTQELAILQEKLDRLAQRIAATERAQPPAAPVTAAGGTAGVTAGVTIDPPEHGA